MTPRLFCFIVNLAGINIWSVLNLVSLSFLLVSSWVFHEDQLGCRLEMVSMSKKLKYTLISFGGRGYSRLFLNLVLTHLVSFTLVGQRMSYQGGFRHGLEMILAINFSNYHQL